MSEKFLEEKIAAKNGELYVKQLQSGSQKKPLFPPLIVLHAGPGGRHDYLSSLSCFTELFEAVVFFDQLGCGLSSADSALVYERDLEEISQDINTVCKYFSYERVVLFGDCVGATIALEWALKNLNKTSCLILSSPMISTNEHIADIASSKSKLSQQSQLDLIEVEKLHSGDTDFFINAENDAYAMQDVTSAVSKYSRAVLEFFNLFLYDVKKIPKELLFSMSTRKHEVWECLIGNSELFDVVGKLKEYDIRSRLRNIKAPVLLTYGENDMIRPSTPLEVGSLFLNSEVKIFPGMKHWPMLEDIELYFNVVKDFLLANQDKVNGV